jgi:hypothetical protein
MRQRRILLKRQSAPVLAWTYLIGGALVFAGIIYFLVMDWRSLGGLGFLLTLAFAGVSLAVVFGTALLLSRKIAFFDNYISFQFWPGRPKVYRFEDVIDIQSVKVEPVFGAEWGFIDRLRRWEFEDNTTIYFADGEKLRIPASAMSPSKVKRRIESKLGIKFDSSSVLGLPANARNKNAITDPQRRARSKKRGSNERNSSEQ